jgi:hypothetical protein
MVDWLYSLPEPVLLALPVLTLVFLIGLLPKLLGVISKTIHDNANTDFVLRMQTTLFSITGLVLAFSLVQADINFRQVETYVSTEAARIDQLDRLLTRYDDANVLKIRGLLRAYAESIARDEWPTMNERGNRKTNQAFGPLSRQILSIDPAPGRQTLVVGEMLKSLEGIAESRALRLNSVNIGLPALYWEVVLFMLGVLILVSCTVEPTFFRSAVLAAQAGVLGVFVGFVFIMDNPFKGENGIGPNAIILTLERMAERVE